jgi:hypothetical protein
VKPLEFISKSPTNASRPGQTTFATAPTQASSTTNGKIGKMPQQQKMSSPEKPAPTPANGIIRFLRWLSGLKGRFDQPRP